jgi:formylglycine-generating enzyme required for sulfatase activity
MPTNLDPIGFWSYTTSDDVASRGDLSHLRRLLRDDLQRLVAREPDVRIFQDASAIPKGADWEERINEALDTASFIIPILTPAFLQSEWCCKEVLRFREREKALGRNNLIFPFHLTDTDHLDPANPREVRDKTVHELLQSRQMLDFRPLELEDPNQRPVLRKLRELSESIYHALRWRRPSNNQGAAVGTPVPSGSPGPSGTPKPGWASAAGSDAFGTWADITVPGMRGPAVTQRLRLIPPGRFQMGSPANEPGRYRWEGPRHHVTIDRGFWLFDTPCTQALWEAVMSENPSRFKSPTRPVETVSFEDVRPFLTLLNARVPGLNLTLPSEAQWEYACRAGSEAATYAGPIVILDTHDAPVLDDIAWYGGNSGVGFELNIGYDSSGWPGKQHPHMRAGSHPTKTKKPNSWGLFDMLGNVWEWCEDHWHDTYQDASADGSARSSGRAVWRVIRGGSWLNDARFVRSACRNGFAPHIRVADVGFRCARVH